jgi:phage replication-related protein YjqB (UPF0714/DUF867 family)
MILPLFAAIVFTQVACANVEKRNTKSADIYASFNELKAHERYGVDYEIELVNRNSQVSIVAIHGGWIEPMTSEIAAQIAGMDLNFYTFRGIKESNNRSLHITSHNFDEPALVQLLAASEMAVSVHGMRGDKIGFCLGGKNIEYKERIEKNLAKIEIFKLNDCDGLEGNHPENVVNLPRKSGVQLELTRALRENLKTSQTEMNQFISAIKLALSNY